jgi:molybdate transport system substrate-binding protein
MRRFIALVLLVAAVGLAWVGLRPDGSGGRGELVVYCAAGLKKPVEELAVRFEKETGIAVSLQYGGTGTLISQIQVARTGDLFIAADDHSLELATGQGLAREALPFATMRPVLAVKEGNPLGLKGIDDLGEARLALANPEAASVSKVTRELIGQERWDKLAAGAAVMKPTVMELAADLALGTVDAAIVWDSTVPQFRGLEAVELAELGEHREPASAAVLEFCAQPALALMFARYLAAPDRGGEVLQAHHFQPSGGDPWVAKPEMVLFSGGVNRPAIEKLVQQFADREGVSVTTVFNGCGILCAQMKAVAQTDGGAMPDAYYACDVCFVPPVAEQFPEAVLLTETAIVIITPKGNPRGIRTLADLAQPDLKVGICNAEQSTLGFMTQAMLKSTNLLEGVMKNVVVQVPTADFLVNQMRAGALEAAIVYQVNVQQVSEHFDMIELPSDLARAVQPFAVRHDSPQYHLSQRLLNYLRENKSAFEDAGFIWTGETEAVPSDKLEIPDYLKGAGGS